VSRAAALALALAACAPAPDTVSLDPVSPQARASREAALRGPGAGTGDGGSPAAGARAAPIPVTPGRAPSPPADRSPNVVAYALETSHPLGADLHARPDGSAERAARACARYGSDQLAQIAFLEAGGPERDPIGLDPDGDGYACGWDPRPFRQAVQ